MRTTKMQKIHRLAPFATAAVLVAILVTSNINAQDVRGAGEYHARVKDAIEQIPYRIGEWRGRDAEVAVSARRLLKPNEILQRRYSNSVTGREVSLLVVHCGDVRDMSGHFPPICYPANGWKSIGTDDVGLTIGNNLATAKWYEFRKTVGGIKHEMTVLNFFVLPDSAGAIVADMDIVRRVSQRSDLAGLGVAQIQILVDTDLTEEARMEIVHLMLDAVDPAIEVIVGGIRSD